MTESNWQFLAIGIAWIGLIAYAARITMRSPSGSVGLPLAFLFSTSFLYCGFAAYAVPGYTHLRPDGNLYLRSYDFSESTVLAGTMASFIGIAGFVLALRLSERRRGTKGQHRTSFISTLDSRKALLVLGIFGVAGFVLVGRNIPIPMVQAVLQVARNAAIGAVCLGAVLAVWSGRSYVRWAALACAIPASYLLFWGFTSFGFVVFTIFAGFWLCQMAPRRWGSLRLGAGSLLVSYGILSLFVTWISFREQLRAVLWSDAGLLSRLGALGDSLSRSEWLSPWNFASLDWINIRLNQYIFVGKMIEWHDYMPNLRLYGQTLYYAFLVWIPRFIWPGKPAMGGNQFVAENTGMRFSETATFGAGQVFEFYVNFGYLGVALGFFVLGLFVRRVDRAAALALKQGRLFDFVRLFVVGVAFVAPLTDFFFMVNTAVISWLVMTALSYVFLTQAGPDYRLPQVASARPTR